ncbi:hypothetical protein Nepgr_026251 [Nepenthes gracilis]|uniref:Choline transporter-like protein n=1 Tax=Nepenthes gracilis TaxID=150966 RepID=A0AAD3T6H9_NEPGR|nr:hypothetical protein Nepgr_026251 [Nepenthes gracilis]
MRELSEGRDRDLREFNRYMNLACSRFFSPRASYQPPNCGDGTEKPSSFDLGYNFCLFRTCVDYSERPVAETTLKPTDICLSNYPMPSEDLLNWVCDCPEGDVHLSTDEWIDKNYDYFKFLTPDIRNTSLQIQGSIASYYLASVKTLSEITFLLVFASTKQLVRYSMGSVALGSLVLSFVGSTRFIFESICRTPEVSYTIPGG